MLGKEDILHFFTNKGVRHVFHLPGIHTLPLDDALSRSTIDVIVGRHEANAGFAADGYARVTGAPGVLLVTPGPGLGNVVTACMEAHAGDVPLIVMFVDVEQKDVPKGVLHGVANPERMFAGICKGTFVVTDGKDLAAVLEAAWRTAVTPRQGPVVIAVPYRILESACPAGSAQEQLKAPVEEAIDEAAAEALLQGKKRPVIIAGAALMDADSGTALGQLCSASHIPLLCTTSGKGVVPEDREYAFGNVIAKGTAQQILRSADVTIALGTRLRDTDARRRGVKVTSLIHADIDARWMGKNYRTSLRLAGDVKRSLAALAGIMGKRRFAWDLPGLKESQAQEQADLEKHYLGFRIIRLLRDAVPDDTVTLWDLTLAGYWAEYYFPVLHQRAFLTPRGISPIFYGVPAAVGARLGNVRSPVLCVTGDASFVATASELATIRDRNLPIVILVCNNTSFGILESFMQKRYGAGGSMRLFTPDIVELSRSFGIRAARAETPEALRQVLLHDVTWEEPFVLEFRCPVFPAPWE
jgi:thiamine pyrophosphate-dependent acetolactate synthase large subunit-like protein